MVDDDDTTTGEELDETLALRESEERFRLICEHAPVMIDSFDDQGHVKLWNRECERTLGWSRDEVAAMDDPLETFYPDERERERAREAITRADGQFREYDVLAKDGSFRRQLWADFRLPSGALIAVGHDVTELRAIESQLRHTQKLDALGRLSTGMAHDLNNLLTVIMVNTQLVEQLAVGSRGILDRTSEIRNAARRGSELVNKLMAFGRADMLHFEKVDLSELVGNLANTLRRLIPERIAIDLDLDDQVPAIHADVGGLEQMIINLATNARDAISNHGNLRIEVKASRDDDGAAAVLRVVDDGAGTTAQVREHMLEPFFTTKPPGAGAGLGLSMVYGLMKQHNGSIEISSEPDRGTCVELTFPCNVDGSGNSETDKPGDYRATVLVAEDEASIRNTARAVLESEGYRVLAAPNGIEALALLEAHPEVDIVISDVVMPRMGGVELYETLQKRNGNMPAFVLTSGYPDRTLESEHAVTWLRKPWTLETLLECVAEHVKS